MVPVTLAALACLAGDTDTGLDSCHPTAASGSPQVCILVFTRTMGFRHSSIPAGILALEALGASHGFSVAATEDPRAFSDATLAHYAAVVFLNTTGDVLDSAQQVAFERYIQTGHGFVGVHAASDTEYGWPWYHTLLGATFLSHPAVQQATVTIANPTHAATRNLPNPWVRTDEWYNFTAQPGGISVLAEVEESTYSGGTMGARHPISWFHSYDGGRAWYTAMGHTDASYTEPEFLAHLVGGMQWAAGLAN